MAARVIDTGTTVRPSLTGSSRSQRDTDTEAQVKLRLQGISKKYGNLEALVDANLLVREGECVTLLGPSGSGKTTLLNIIAGLLPLDTGDVWIGNTLATHLPTHKRDIGMVFQNYALFPHLSVFHNVAFPLQMRRFPQNQVRERVQKALAAVSLADKSQRMPSELSGGQQQRIALARALVYEPPIILMDEPLAALDKKLREQLQLEIRHVQQRLGITMLYVTHDQQEALLLSDRICLMNNARIEQIGSPSELYFRPRTLFAAEFIGESNIFPAEITGVSGADVCLRGPAQSILRARTDRTVAAGQTVNVMIRPEQLQIRPADRKDVAENYLRGRLTETTFLGEFTRYYVALPTGQTLVCKMITAAGASDYKSGKDVALVVERDSIVILSD